PSHSAGLRQAGWPVSMLRAKNYLVQATLRRNGVYAAARSALTSMTVSDLVSGFRCTFQRLLTVTREPSRRLWISCPSHDNFSRASFSILVSAVGNFVLNRLCVRAPSTSCGVHP